MAEQARSPQGSAGGARPPSPFELSAGDVLPAQSPGGGSAYFEVRNKIAQGGQGVVYLAQSDDGTVAIVKGPRFAGVRDLVLEREAHHLVAVSPHPNVVRLLGTNKDPRGHSLLFLERCFENPLNRLNREDVKPRLDEREKRRLAASPPRASGIFGKPRLHAPPLSIALEIGYELALGLEHLHTKGLVHADVKPSNVMLAIDWREVELPIKDYCERLVQGRFRGVLIDLGGARTAKELDALARGLPVVKAPRMTVAYVPPEVLPGLKDPSGERPRHGPAMDAYAFGLTLYQLVTGHAPYSHLKPVPDTNDPAALAPVKREERDGQKRPISRAALDEVDWSDCELEGMTRAAHRDELVDEVWHLLARATHPDPTQRARVSELRTILGKILDVTEVAPEEAASRRNASSDDPRTVRPWFQRRFRLDAFASRLSDAGRGGPARDPKSFKIQKKGGDFWEMQGFTPK